MGVFFRGWLEVTSNTKAVDDDTKTVDENKNVEFFDALGDSVGIES